MPRKLTRDALMNADSRLVAECCMGVVNSIQDRRPEAQVLGTVAAALTACEAFGIPTQEAFAAATNVMNHKDGRKPEFRAARLYMENEI